MEERRHISKGVIQSALKILFWSIDKYKGSETIIDAETTAVAMNKLQADIIRTESKSNGR